MKYQRLVVVFFLLVVVTLLLGSGRRLAQAALITETQQVRYICIIEGTVHIEPDILNAIKLALSNAEPELNFNGAECFAPIHIRDEGEWRFIPLVGLKNIPQDLSWTVELNGIWSDVAIVHKTNTGIYAAIAGTKSFSSELEKVPERIVKSESKVIIDLLSTHKSLLTTDETYIFPFPTGHNAWYGSLGVHYNNWCVFLGSNCMGVDLGVAGYNSNPVPNELRAVIGGTVTNRCSEIKGSDYIYVTNGISQFVYGHIKYETAPALYSQITQGQYIGQLKTGPISDGNCGSASQGSNDFHVHLGFPNMASLTLGEWTLNTSSGIWQRGTETWYSGSWKDIGSGSPICPQSGGVILYWDNNYSCNNNQGDVGYRQRTSTGFENISGAFNEQASSLKVPSGWSVRLFEHAGGGGDKICRNGDDSDFAGDTFDGGIGLNDKVSSFEVFNNVNCSQGCSKVVSLPEGYSKCVDEGDICSFSGTKDVAFGADNKYKIKTGVTNSISCSNNAFECDPNPGVVKECYYKTETPSGNWQASYYNDTNLGSPCGPAGSLDGVYVFKDWMGEGPSGCNADNWSARFTKSVYLQGGAYNFGLGSDDWSKIKIDGNTVVNNWQSANQHYESYNISSGWHDVVIDFADTLGNARIAAWWWGPGFDMPRQNRDPNQWYAQFWGNGKDMWWDSIVRVNEGTDQLNHNWGNGNPGYNLPSDRFSSRFERQVNFSCGTYRFHIKNDDGVRFYVDGQIRKDEWYNQMGEYYVDVDLTSGYHELKVEHFEEGGDAKISLDWSQTSSCPAPNAFSKLSPSNGASSQPINPTLSWQSTSLLTKFEYCLDNSNDNNCSNWIDNGTNTSVNLSGLNYSTTYYWHVRAWNSSSGPTYSDGSYTAFRSFTTQAIAPNPPGAFNKNSPSNGSSNQLISPTLSWQLTSPITKYEYCYDTTSDNNCTNWVDNLTSTLANLSGLNYGTTYYWHVRAWNGSAGPTYSNANSSAFWSFTTQSYVASSQITFLSDREGNREIYLMNANGTGQLQLTNNSWSDWSPIWSPDGNKIAYFSDLNGGHEIYIMNADGSGQTRLSNSPAYDYDPSWSPDDKRIAFHSYRDGNAEIYIMNSDGSNQTRLTNNSSPDYHASWAPDDTHIAFSSERDGNSEIYVINDDGSGQTRLTNNSSSDSAPMWTSDGNFIVFISNRDSNQEIYRMKPDGSEQTRLTFNSASDFDPSGSCSGTQVVFASERNGAADIYVMNIDGSGLVRLTNNPSTDMHPSFLSCSRWIYLPVIKR